VPLFSPETPHSTAYQIVKPTQVIHEQTGLLAHSVEGTAYQIRFLLSNPAIATRLGDLASATC
jgi:hypothetical protein